MALAVVLSQSMTRYVVSTHPGILSALSSLSCGLHWSTQGAFCGAKTNVVWCWTIVDYFLLISVARLSLARAFSAGKRSRRMSFSFVVQDTKTQARLAYILCFQTMEHLNQDVLCFVLFLQNLAST